MTRLHSLAHFLALPIIGLLLTAASRAAEPSAADLEFFEKKIRPVLVDQCFKCHSGAKLKGGLALDSRALLLKGGETGAAIVPGDPEKSLLIKAVRYADDLRMPPRTKLADSVIADLVQWVKCGAPWPETGTGKNVVAKEFNLAERRASHWAWQPVKAVEPPPGNGFVKTPVDAFILAKLKAAGLTPARPANRRTLVRRVTFDLTGLPPTPEEMEAAVNDQAADWYVKLVDKLLASHHYGERWGRHWLDLVRFAESHGHEFDFDIPSAYQYRDYIIRAFNADVPYDQLLTEHLAGDLLPTPRRHPTEGFNESIIGTGFWHLGEGKHSPVDLRVDEADRLDNQIDVFSKTFLAMTVSCARCHDHKFDAISTRDYYALMGYLESSRPQHAYLDDPQRTAIVEQMRDVHGQVRKAAVSAAARALTEKAASLAKVLLATRAAGNFKEDVDQAQRERWTRAMNRTGAWRPDHVLFPWQMLANHTEEDSFEAVRKSILAQLKAQAGRASDSDRRTVVFADFRKDTFRDWYVTGDAFGSGPTRVPTPLLDADKPGTIKQTVPTGVAHSGLVSNKLQGVLRSQTFTITKSKVLYQIAGKGAQVNLVIDGLQLIRDPIYGGLTFKVDHGEVAQWKTMDVRMWVGHKAYIEVIDDGPGFVALDKVVFADDASPPQPAPNYLILQLLDDPNLVSADRLARSYQELIVGTLKRWRGGELNKDDTDRIDLLNAILQSEPLAALPGGDEPPEALAALHAELRQLEEKLPAPRRAMAMADGNGWNERVYIRGNPKTLGSEVPRRLLEALGGLEQPAPQEGSGRLDLARRLLDPANPLTARVLVNRLWKHHFGEGLVRSVDNFGVLGETPSHPELLDWLAAEFVKRKWSLKEMHRLMVLSNTYQMASKIDDTQAEEKDPTNQLLHRMPIRRLEAEAIRDSILAVSGRLDRAPYSGPSVPVHLTAHMSGRGRPGRSGPADGDGRRSIYLGVRRNFLTPMFLAFDYPIPFTAIGKRTSSNVPAQALILMNNPLVVQQAELWARNVLAEPKLSTAERVNQLYVTAFGRPPEAMERKEAEQFLQEQGKLRGGDNHPQAWADLCHVLFNVKEFIFIN